MKKLFVTCSLFLYLLNVQAQSPVKQDWKSEFPLKAESRLINDDRTLILGGNNNELAMMDGLTGKILWQLNYKEKLGQKKAKDWSWDKQINVVWVDVKGESKDEVITSYFKDATGEKITEQEYKKLRADYEKDIRWVKKSALIIDEHSTDVWLDYQPKKIVGSTGKGAKGKVTVKANGSNTWSTDIEIRYVRALCANAMGRNGSDYIKLAYSRDKIFVIYEGMSVIDIKTGKLLWQTDLDNTDMDFGLFKSTQTPGRAGLPYTDETGVYVADLSKGQYNIKKFNIETGSLIWQSEKFDNDDVVPSLQVIDGVLIAQFGGRLRTETYIPGVEGRPDVCKTEIKFAGDAGLRAYDINDGKLLWETSKMKALNDKFSGAITNLIKVNQTICVASDKNFYVFDKDGNVKYSTAIKALKIGKPETMELYAKDVILLQGSAGVALISLKDNKVMMSASTGKCFDYQKIGEAFYVWTGKSQFELSEFVRVDMETGSLLSKAKDMSYPYFSPDGEYVTKLDGSKVMRFKTK